MMLMHDNLLRVDLAKTDGQTEVQLNVHSVRFRPSTTHHSRDEGHISTGSDGHLADVKNTTGSRDQEKNFSQVLRYGSSPFDCSGGGTSNNTMFREWLRRIPWTSLLRTELAQSSTKAPIAASSFARS